MTIAIVREISPAFAQCELTHIEREPIDIDLARRQHESYCSALARMGCQAITLPADPNHPDCVFVEDTAVVLDEITVMAHPGAPSRRGELTEVERTLAPYRTIEHITEPGTLDGGDVCIVGRAVYVGLTARTNLEGMQQLRKILAPLGYEVTPVEVSRCLHLKSACTSLGDNRVLVNPARLNDPSTLAKHELIEVYGSEPDAANTLRIGDALLYSDAFPRTQHRLALLGYRVIAIDISELAKAEGAVTCSSLIINE